MLGKLMKHEFKATYKFMLSLFLILAVLTVFARISAQSLFSETSTLSDSPGFEIFSVLTMFMYIMGFFAVSFGSFIYLIMRFYKNLFSAEGYLMHTLPVTSWELLLSKLLTGFIWNLSEGILILLSLFTIFANTEVFDSAAEFLNFYGGFEGFIYYYTDMSLAGFWFFIIAFVLIATLHGLLLPYACICIGQLWQKHKLVGAFICYFVITIILQIISLISSAFISSGVPEGANYFPLKNYTFSLVLNLISMVAYFFISGFIMKKKTNLD